MTQCPYCRGGGLILTQQLITWNGSVQSTWHLPWVIRLTWRTARNLQQWLQGQGMGGGGHKVCWDSMAVLGKSNLDFLVDAKRHLWSRNKRTFTHFYGNTFFLFYVTHNIFLSQMAFKKQGQLWSWPGKLGVMHQLIRWGVEVQGRVSRWKGNINSKNSKIHKNTIMNRLSLLFDRNLLKLILFDKNT